MRDNNIYEFSSGERMESFIADLRAGNNPFDAATLEQLRSEGF